MSGCLCLRCCCCRPFRGRRTPPDGWSGILDAAKYGRACPQLQRYGVPESSDDGDCLHSNVAVPHPTVTGPKRPVIVWIHGGAFVGEPRALYSLDRMAKSADINKKVVDAP